METRQKFRKPNKAIFPEKWNSQILISMEKEKGGGGGEATMLLMQQPARWPLDTAKLMCWL